MKNQRILRCLLLAAAAAAVGVPLVAQVRKSHAIGPAGAALAAPGPNDAARTAPDDPFSLGPVAPSTKPAVDPNKVVLTVGDQKVTAGEFNNFVSELPPQVQSQVLSRPDGKRLLADELVKVKLLSDEAKRRKVEDSPKGRLLQQQALAQALMQSMSEDTAANQKFFNEHKDNFDQLKARHILIATTGSPVPAPKKLSDADARAKAEDIKKRLDKGEDFAKIAKAESDDTGSGAEGGSLGTFSRAQMVAPFSEVAFGLKKGEISGPVKTQFGYHIIQALDRTTPPFDEVRREVAQRRLEAMVDDLKKADPAQLDESFFGGKKPEPTSKPAVEPTTKPAESAAKPPLPTDK